MPKNDMPTLGNDVPYVLPFADIRANDLPSVGGKGANLGEMAAAGFPVPPGFCVTTAAFRAFLETDPDVETIFSTLATVDLDALDTLRRAGQAVRDQLVAIAMPTEIAEIVAAAWQTVGTEFAYAVRSSATAEDLPSASFAGQQDTFLNVRGADALLDSVKQCWISLFTDRAILYRIQNDFDHRDVLLAVVVQRMVEPDVSGILFTADPVSGNRHIVSIDASYGLGDALVSGLVSADLYKVDKRTQKEIDAQIADKQIAIWPLSEGGTEQRPVEENLRTRRALSPGQTLTLSALCTRIESHYGTPQDIEWALVGDELFILQSRPITSLYPLPEPAPMDEALHVYVSFGHPQMMTDPMPPMAVSVLRLLVSFGRSPDSADYNLYATTAGGRIYPDVTPLLLDRLGRQIITRFFTVADRLTSDVLRQLVAEPDFQSRGKAARSKASTRGIISWIAPIGRGVFADVWWRNPEGRTDEVTVWCDEFYDEVKSTMAAAEAGADRLRLARNILSTALRIILGHVAHNVGGGFASQLLVRKLVGDRADPDDLAAYMRGLSGNVTTDMDLAVGDLADVARQSPTLVEHLETHDARTAITTLNDVEGGPAFRAEWDQFLARYGMRGPAEIDISRPRWRDDPTSLMQMLLGNLGHAEPGAHRRRHAELAAESDAAAQRLTEAAHHGLAGSARAALVRREMKVARNLAPVREHPKYLLVRILGIVREALLEAGDLLVNDGRLDERIDIWFLYMGEAIDALEQPDEELRSRIMARKADLQHFEGLTPPRVMTSDGEIPIVSHKRDDLPKGALPGNPVSAGVVEGTARVVLDPAMEQVRPGEILVAPFTDPGWTPLFINAAGLVLEVGGLMTHGSVVAREYGIPAVVGVLDATTQIETGQRLRVSGDEGFVEILSDNEPEGV